MIAALALLACACVLVPAALVGLHRAECRRLRAHHESALDDLGVALAELAAVRAELAELAELARGIPLRAPARDPRLDDMRQQLARRAIAGAAPRAIAQRRRLRGAELAGIVGPVRGAL